VNTENAAFDDCANSEVVKNFSAVLPRVCIAILAQDFIVETVNCSNLTSLVVASEESD